MISLGLKVIQNRVLRLCTQDKTKREFVLLLGVLQTFGTRDGGGRGSGPLEVIILDLVLSCQ